MQILHTWKESFAIFVPKNLKLFLLVTLNAIIDTFITLLKYWWFLYAIVLFLFTPMLNWIMVLTCLSARPSTWLKNYAYFGRYLLRFWYVPFLIFFFLIIGLHKIPLLSLLFLLFILFLIDSDGSIMSIGWSMIRAIKMLMYNLPLFIIIEVFIQGLIWGIGLLHLGFLSYLILIFILFIMTIFVCLVTNIYVKKLHDQSELYFPTPK